MFLLLTLNIFHTFFSASIADFEQVNMIWEGAILVPFQAGIYLFKANNKNTRTCEICSRLTIKTPERYSNIFSDVLIVDFKQLNASWITV